MPRIEDRKEENSMATYKDIQDDIQQRHLVAIKTCWIADVKRKYGKTKRIAPNRLDPLRAKYPCPLDKQVLIEESLRRFGDL
jgi:hypothetical protein